MSASVFGKYKGSSPWDDKSHGTSSGEEQYGSTAAWCAARNNATNAWYVNVANGNVNNTNTYNRYRVAGAAELHLPISDEMLLAEADCYKNKHRSFDAARVHYHLTELIPIAEAVENGTWQPGTSTRFMVKRPVPREIYASFYPDRPVHHYVCMLLCRIAEFAYHYAGDVSHGNRKNHSAQTAAEQIMENIRKMSWNYTRPCYIAKHDIAGFFMSIDREKALETIKILYAVMPDKRPGDDEKMKVLERILLHDDTSDCVLHCPQEDMDLVPIHKRLTSERGLAIGKYPNQITAGIVLSKRDYRVARFCDVLTTRFVDDCIDIGPTIEAVQEAAAVAEEELEAQGLKLHPKKVYIHPASHGVNFCGRVIKYDRIYISNRVVRACKHAIRNPNATPEPICASVNSYFGLMCHCRAYNIQKRLADEVLARYGDYLYFKVESGHFICVLKKKQQTDKLEDYYESLQITTRGCSYHRNCRERKRDRWHKNRSRAVC